VASLVASSPVKTRHTLYVKGIDHTSNSGDVIRHPCSFDFWRGCGAMKHTLVIGLSGRARAGKDTSSQAIIDARGDQYDIRRSAFGDALKVELYDALLQPMHPYWATPHGRDYFVLPHPANQFEHRSEKIEWVNRYKDLLGKHLQTYGTDFIRAQDSFHWVRAWKKQLDIDQPQVSIVTDVRFLNEAYLVKALGGFMVRINRHGFVLTDGRSMAHKSETELDDFKFDYTINVEDGQVEELRQDAVAVFDLIIQAMTPKIPDIDNVVSIAL
jgi:hypothetical protein